MVIGMQWKYTHLDGQTRHLGIARSSAVKSVVNLVKTAETLVPYSKDSVNLGLLLWNKIDEIPEEDRVKMLDELTNADILRLWRLAGQRHEASIADISSSKVPSYSIWNDLPGEDSSLVRYRGRAALPIRLLGQEYFEKAFFSMPGEDKETPHPNIYGRVFHGNVLKNRGYPGPLYFKAAVGGSLVPMLSDTCDMVLSYALPEEEEGELAALASDLGWVGPRKNPPPFDGDFTDYVRVVGPGVLVGLRYQEETPAATGLSRLFPRPLFFAMIRIMP
jgi:hypothetical protein